MTTFSSILQKQLDESTFCPLCKASMYWIEADEYGQEVQLHECSHCQHQIFQDQKHSCHCDSCTQQRKQALKEVRLQEAQRYKKQEQIEHHLEKLRFIDKLFLLAMLDDQIVEGRAHDEYIPWDHIKYQHISPNFLFQQARLKELVKNQVLLPKSSSDEAHIYQLNVKLDGYADPSLFSVTRQLRFWFYDNLRHGVPFRNADEVKDALYLLMYQEIVQFMQFYCRTWGVQIASNNAFQSFCYQLLDTLAAGQIFYMIQTALDYLHSQKALQPRNDNFINTNILKKTLMQYRERAVNEKWETFTLPRPPSIPLSKMSEILFFKFLGYDEKIFIQPIWRSWKKIASRLNFYSLKRCMHCGSNDLTVEYDADHYISLTCRNCKYQDHYFTE